MEGFRHGLRGILFSFSRSGITEDGITDDFLRAIVSGLFLFCVSGWPGANGQGMTMTTMYIIQLFIHKRLG